jgi:peroxiredoxin
MIMLLRDALAALYAKLDADQLAHRYAAVAQLIEEEEKRRVVQVGDRIAAFTINHPDGGSLSSAELLEKGPLLVNFYRGLWCSYCQRDLLGLEAAFSEICKANASVIAITRDLRPDARIKLKQAAAISFPVIDDTDGLIAELFGLRWGPSDASLIATEAGTDLVTLRGTAPWILPMQARYLIQQDGVIAFANVAFDYNERTDPDAVLPKLAELAASQ